MNIYEKLVRLKKEGKPCALATIVQSFGSSPQKEGTNMALITAMHLDIDNKMFEKCTKTQRKYSP